MPFSAPLPSLMTSPSSNVLSLSYHIHRIPVFAEPMRRCLIDDQLEHVVTSPQARFHLPFFGDTTDVNIRGGVFYSDIGGNLSEFDQGKHTHCVNSHNTTRSTTTSSFNESSIQEEGKLSLICFDHRSRQTPNQSQVR